MWRQTERHTDTHTEKGNWTRRSGKGVCIYMKRGKGISALPLSVTWDWLLNVSESRFLPEKEIKKFPP